MIIELVEVHGPMFRMEGLAAAHLRLRPSGLAYEWDKPYFQKPSSPSPSISSQLNTRSR